MMSSYDREKMRNSESIEFPMKSEIEASSSLSTIKLENNDLVESVALFDDGSLFMDPGMEFKAEPEIFESSEGDMKYSFGYDESVSEEDLKSCHKEVNKEDEGTKNYLRGKEEWDKGEVNEEVIQIEEGIGNRGCEKPLCQENYFKTHADVDTREKSYVCGNNEKFFSGIENFNTHMSVHTGGHLADHYRIHTGEKPFMIEGGRKPFFYKKTFSKHRTHNMEKPIKCNLCRMVFYHKDIFNRHSRIHPGEKPFKCNACDKAYSNQCNFSIHMRIHAGNLFVCHECGKEFTEKHALSEHFKCHNGEKPFKCNVCEKVFSQKDTFTKHYKIHTGERPFKCNLCDKTYTKKCHLTAHMRIHSGNLFKCRECGKEFTQKYILTEHFRSHTGEKPFKCDVCDKIFSHGYYLAQHYKIHHEEKKSHLDG